MEEDLLSDHEHISEPEECDDMETEEAKEKEADARWWRGTERGSSSKRSVDTEVERSPCRDSIGSASTMQVGKPCGSRKTVGSAAGTPSKKPKKANEQQQGEVLGLVKGWALPQKMSPVQFVRVKNDLQQKIKEQLTIFSGKASLSARMSKITEQLSSEQLATCPGNSADMLAKIEAYQLKFRGLLDLMDTTKMHEINELKQEFEKYEAEFEAKAVEFEEHQEAMEFLANETRKAAHRSKMQERYGAIKLGTKLRQKRKDKIN